MLRKLAFPICCIEKLSEWSGRVVGCFILGMIGVLIYEVIVRYGFSSPTVWAHETAQMLCSSYSMLIGAYALLYCAHVKMDLFYGWWAKRTQAREALGFLIPPSIKMIIFGLLTGVSVGRLYA